MTGVLTVGTWSAVSWIATAPDLALSTPTALFGGGTWSASYSFLLLALLPKFCVSSPVVHNGYCCCGCCCVVRVLERQEASGVKERRALEDSVVLLLFMARTYSHGDPLARSIVVSLNHGLGEARVVVGRQVVVSVAPFKVAKGIRRVSATVSTACFTGRITCRSDHGEGRREERRKRVLLSFILSRVLSFGWHPLSMRARGRPGAW